jgi:hypothetical protein
MQKENLCATLSLPAFVVQKGFETESLCATLVLTALVVQIK